MSRHTKGPWVIFEGGITDKEIVITTQERNDAPKVPICEMDVFFDGIVGEEQEANAYLIAAAPEQYAALIATQSLLERLGLESSDEYQSNAAAIAKAKGEQA